MRAIILVDEGVYAKGEAVFRAAADVHCVKAPAAEAALAAAVAEHGACAVIVGTKPYTGPLYEALAKKSGALIARFGVGHDSVNKDLARRHGIIVTNTPGVLDVSVAEHTIGLLCSLARHIAATHTEMRAGKFAPQTGLELCGKTLGILGFGNIGRRVAAIAHFGLGMEVLACDQVAAPANLAALGAARYTNDVEELFRQSDAISIHLPAIASTQKFINAARLAWLKPAALLINTARGAVLDEAALFDALAADRLAGAALDVFEREPYVPAQSDKDLRTLGNVVLTPHIGSNTREANARMAAGALANVRHFLAGRLELLNRVDGG
jgi:lactate dehydrogenase-like 2-hydroxyacid dehydrogenase